MQRVGFAGCDEQIDGVTEVRSRECQELNYAKIFSSPPKILGQGLPWRVERGGAIMSAVI